METIIDNSLVTVDWQQITNKIDQLNQLKNNPEAIGDMIAVANSLNSMLLRYAVETNNASNIKSFKHVSVVMPSVYVSSPSITTIQNQEHAVMNAEVAQYGAPVDMGTFSNEEEDKIITTDKIIITGDDIAATFDKMPIKNEASEASSGITSPKNIPNLDIEVAGAIISSSVEENVGVEKETPPIEEKTVEESVEHKPVSEEKEEASIQKEETVPVKQFSIWEAYSSNEIPTLTQQQYAPKTDEHNKYIPLVSDDRSYNGTNASTPIKDLKKAISVSDRYLFINELFRGEESEYERSIKTINNFNVYQEARYWMDRELKLKLGWDDKRPVVKQFINLVQRRFA